MLYRILYSDVASSVNTWKLEYNTENERHTKKRDKCNKKSKRLQWQREIGEIRIKYFTRKKNENDLIESFKIIDDISNYSKHFFKYFSSN